MSGRYWAFISYSHQDEAWAQWLHRTLETYRVPRRLVGQATDAGVIPRRLFPIFRDRDELPSSHELGAVINRALADSRNLIVICSPRAASSRWVNEEIKAFRALGRSHRVFCLIVDGEPHASANPEHAFAECFAPALRGDAGFEPIAADARPRKDGRAGARLKLLAGLLGVGLDELKQREKQRRFWQRVQMSVAGLAVVAAIAGSWQWFEARRQAREKEILVERLVENGRLELLDGRQARAAVYLNEALKLGHDTEPLRFMLGQAMRVVDAQSGVRVRHGGGHVRHASFSPDGSRLLLIVEHAGRVAGQVYDAASGAQQSTLEGVPDFPRIVQFLPDGQSVLVSGFLRSDAASRAEDGPRTGVWHLGHPEPLLTLEGGSGRAGTPIDPPGRHLVAARADGGLDVWDTSTARRLKSLATGRQFRAVSYAHHHALLASADSAGVVELWSSETMRPLARLPGFEGQAIVGIQFTPDDARVLAFSQFGDVRIWDVRARRQVLAFAADPAWIGRVAFSADGRRFLTVGGEGYKVWSAARGVLLFARSLSDAWFASAALSPDGNFLYTADAASAASEVWSVRSRTRLHSLEAHTGAVTAVALDADGRRLLLGSIDGTAEIWNTPINPLLGSELIGETPYSVAFDDAAGALLVAGGGASHGRAFLMDLRSGEATREFRGHDAYVRATALAPEAELLLTAGADGTSILWDLREGRRRATLDQQPYWMNLAALSLGAQRAATASYSARHEPHAAGTLWDPATGTRVADLVHDRPIYSMSFSPDGSLLATASEDATVKLWNTDNGALQHVLEGHGGPALSAQFAPDGDRLVTSGQDNSIRVWDARTGAALATLDDPAVGWGIESIFAPDGDTVAVGTGEGNILLWQPGSAGFRALRGHSLRVLGLRFLHEGSILLSRGADGTVRAWDPRAGVELATVAAPGGFIHAMDVNADSSRLAVASSTYYVGVWDLALERRSAAQVTSALDCRVSWGLAGSQLAPRQPTPAACRDAD